MNELLHREPLFASRQQPRRQTPATANSSSPGSEYQVRVIRPFSASASPHCVTGISQRRRAKLSSQ